MKTTFTIMPSDANYMYPLVFGGAFFSQIDLCAAITARDYLIKNNYQFKQAITHTANVVWFKPSYVGDIIELNGQVTSIGEKSLVIQVVASRKYSNDVIARADLVFVSIDESSDLSNKPDMLPYRRHGLDKRVNNESAIP
jgi:acyl-CoA hydrolase